MTNGILGVRHGPEVLRIRSLSQNCAICQSLCAVSPALLLQQRQSAAEQSLRGNYLVAIAALHLCVMHKGLAAWQEASEDGVLAPGQCLQLQVRSLSLATVWVVIWTPCTSTAAGCSCCEIMAPCSTCTVTSLSQLHQGLARQATLGLVECLSKAVRK